MNTKKRIFYPSQEDEIPKYFSNIANLLNTKLAAKYDVSATDLALINNCEQQIPSAIAKAHDDAKIAKSSRQAKDDALNQGEVDLKRVLQNITSRPDFDEADAEAMGIRQDNTPISPNDAKAHITGITVLPDQIIIDWLKGQMHGVLVETSYDGANWVKLDKDNRSPYEDTHKNQVHQQAETRHYRLRYIYKDQLVGHYSDVVKAEVAIY